MRATTTGSGLGWPCALPVLKVNTRYVRVLFVDWASIAHIVVGLWPIAGTLAMNCAGTSILRL